MPKSLSVEKFTLLGLLYLGVSLLVHISIAFTSQAWIIYFFTLLPVYGACTIFLLLLTFVRPKNSKRRIRYRWPFLLPALFLQGLVLITSPASCYGWSQGLDCYSFIQSRLNEIKPTLDASANPPHWQAVESAFPIVLLLYFAAIVLFGATCRVEDRPTNGSPI